MPRGTKTVRLPADSELAQALKDATRDGGPVVIDTGESVYLLSIGPVPVESSTQASEDTMSSEQGIRDSAGRWKGIVDADAFKAYVRERRHTLNRPSVRL